ncbi:MAG: hypothetical protein HXY34_03305 [Candidatus Thorarchaeota archaeon]|nr:hypothetical protein [Candidatus Thorarchaeota archaeon]
MVLDQSVRFVEVATTNPNEKAQLERFRSAVRFRRLSVDLPDAVPPSEEIKHLRAALNQAVFSSSQKWMLPRWAVRRLEDKSSGTTSPRGIINDYRDDWFCIGGVGARYHAEADSSGLIDPRTGCGSFDVWFYKNNEVCFPALSLSSDSPRLSLESASDEILSYRDYFGPLEFTRLVYHVVEGSAEAVYNEISIKNVSLEPASFTFFAALRPLSLNGFEPVESLEYIRDEGTLYSNGIVALEVDKAPTALVMTSADNPNLPTELLSVLGSVAETDPILQGSKRARFDTSYSTPRCAGTAVLKYDLRLGPASTTTLFFISPLTRITKATRGRPFTKTSRCRDESVERWFDFSDSTLSASFPDSRLDAAVAQAKAVLAKKSLAMTTGDEDHGPMLTDRESARVLTALTRIGAHELAQQVGCTVASRLAPSSSTDLNEVLPLVWAVSQVYEYSRSTTYAQTIRSFGLKWSSTLKDESPLATSPTTAAPPKGPETSETEKAAVTAEKTTIEPRPAPTEEEAPWVAQLRRDMEAIATGVVVESATATEQTASPPESKPSIAPVPTLQNVTNHIVRMIVCESLAVLLDAVGERAQAEEMSQISRRLHDHLGDLSRQTITADRMRTLMATEEGQTEALRLLDVLTLPSRRYIDSSLVDVFVDAIKSTMLKRRFLKPPGSERYLPSYLGLRLAQLHTIRSDSDSAEQLLTRALEYLNASHTLPELVDPESTERGAGGGCCILASSDLLLLLVMMVLREEGSDLVVLPGLPEDWFMPTNPLAMERIPTRRGVVTVEVGTSANQHQIDIQMEYLPQELEVHVPTTRAMSMVKVYGGSVVSRVQSATAPHIRLVPLSNNVVLTFHK